MYDVIALEHIFYVYAAKHILLTVDYFYTGCKASFELNDLLFGLGNLMFYANLAVNTKYKDTNSYLYITAIVKTSVDILLYTTSVAFRANPVNNSGMANCTSTSEATSKKSWSTRSTFS